jgi:hypothetical protein
MQLKQMQMKPKGLQHIFAFGIAFLSFFSPLFD